MRLFQFSLLEIGNWVAADQSTGRVIHVPNGKVFGEALINYSKGFQYIWNEIPVRITFESDWQKAKGLLQEIADRHAASLSPEEQSILIAADGGAWIGGQVLTVSGGGVHNSLLMEQLTARLAPIPVMIVKNGKKPKS